MATLYVQYCARTKISCAGGANPEVILCLRESALVAPAVCPSPSEATYAGAFAEASICQFYNNGDSNCPTLWYYKFSYDSSILADENTPLQPADITGVFCRDCMSDYFEYLTGEEVHVIDNPDETQTLVSQHGCMYPLVVTGQNLLNCEYVASQYGGYTQESLEAAIADTGSSKGKLYVDCGDWAITDSMTSPQNVEFVVLPGAVLTISNTKVLTINGSFSAPSMQVFAGAGDVSFGPGSLSEILPTWWGALGDNFTDCLYATVKAIKAAQLSNGGDVKYYEGHYRHSSNFNVPGKVNLLGVNPKSSDLLYVPTSGDFITLTDGVGNTFYNQIKNLGIRAVTTSSGAAITSPSNLIVADVFIDNYEIEGFLRGIYLPYGLHVQVGIGRGLGQGPGVANGVGVQLGNRLLGTPRLINTAIVEGAYMNGYETSFVSDGSIHKYDGVTSENCQRAFLVACRCNVDGSWVQATVTLFETRAAGWSILANENYYLDGANAEVDDVSSMCILNGQPSDLGVYNKGDIKGPGNTRCRFMTTSTRALQFGAAIPSVVYNPSDLGILRIDSQDTRVLDLNRASVAGTTYTVLGARLNNTLIGAFGVSLRSTPVLLGSGGSNIAVEWDDNQNVFLGTRSMGTVSTNGYVYLPMGAGPPSGVPSLAGGGSAAWYWDNANHDLYVYDTAWRLV